MLGRASAFAHRRQPDGREKGCVHCGVRRLRGLCSGHGGAASGEAVPRLPGTPDRRGDLRGRPRFAAERRRRRPAHRLRSPEGSGTGYAAVRLGIHVHTEIQHGCDIAEVRQKAGGECFGERRPDFQGSHDKCRRKAVLSVGIRHSNARQPQRRDRRRSAGADSRPARYRL